MVLKDGYDTRNKTLRVEENGSVLIIQLSRKIQTYHKRPSRNTGFHAYIEGQEW